MGGGGVQHGAVGGRREGEAIIGAPPATVVEASGSDRDHEEEDVEHFKKVQEEGRSDVSFCTQWLGTNQLMIQKTNSADCSLAILFYY